MPFGGAAGGLRADCGGRVRGSAGSNTAADHVEATRLALGFLEWLTAPSRLLHYSVGMTVTEDMQAAILKVPAAAWTPAYDGEGQVRDGAWVADITGLLDLSSWPAGMRVIVLLTARTRLDGTITLDFPAASPAETPAPDGLAQALGARPRATYRTGALGDLLATVGDEAAVRSLKPDFTAIARLAHRNGIRGIIVTAAAADRHSGYDFVSRYFAAASGIPEDPVTGSAHTALAPYWSHRLGRDSLTGLQASDRTGPVHTAVHGDRVHLTGHAVTVLDGTLGPPAVQHQA